MTAPSSNPEQTPGTGLSSRQAAPEGECGVQEVRGRESGSQGRAAASGGPESPQTPADGPEPLRVLVTGSRSWPDKRTIEAALLDCWHDATQLGAPGIVVVHGAAKGADRMAAQWAARHGQSLDPVPAGWDWCVPDCPPGHRQQRRDGAEYCPTAGHRRNQAMVDAGASVCLAFQVGGSTGTADCIRRAEAAGIPVRRFTAGDPK